MRTLLITGLNLKSIQTLKSVTRVYVWRVHIPDMWDCYIQNKIIRNIKLIDVLKNILYNISINDVTYKRVFITNIKFCCQPFALIIITWQVKKIKSSFGDSYVETGIMCVHYSVKHFKISSSQLRYYIHTFMQV